MALEQLPVVSFGEAGAARINEWDISEVEDAKTGGVEPTVSAVVVPMSRKARDMGHPRLDGALGRPTREWETWATRHVRDVWGTLIVSGTRLSLVVIRISHRQLIPVHLFRFHWQVGGWRSRKEIPQIVCITVSPSSRPDQSQSKIALHKPQDAAKIVLHIVGHGGCPG